mmetsp:Transcript_5580/g.8295  ORF Transcript_5580/g.8295 Transcript_5580/m.8295 type:complete len:288 (+) Transcript_5580:672-1535(+)
MPRALRLWPRARLISKATSSCLLVSTPALRHSARRLLPLLSRPRLPWQWVPYRARLRLTRSLPSFPHLKRCMARVPRSLMGASKHTAPRWLRCRRLWRWRRHWALSTLASPSLALPQMNLSSPTLSPSSTCQTSPPQSSRSCQLASVWLTPCPDPTLWPTLRLKPHCAVMRSMRPKPKRLMCRRSTRWRMSPRPPKPSRQTKPLRTKKISRRRRRGPRRRLLWLKRQRKNGNAWKRRKSLQGGRLLPAPPSLLPRWQQMDHHASLLPSPALAFVRLTISKTTNQSLM